MDTLHADRVPGVNGIKKYHWRHWANWEICCFSWGSAIRNESSLILRSQTEIARSSEEGKKPVNKQPNAI